MTSGSGLKTIRKSKRLTQQALADLIGKTRSQIAEWEGRTLPDEENRRLLARALKVTPEEIGPAWNPESPRAERLLQQSHNPLSQPHVTAPSQPFIGVAMGPGDQALWDQIVGAWLICRDEEERRALAEHVRSFVEQPAERRSKKAAR
jgi:transcriptional regulator with XRE-family HTH domain